MDRDFVKRIAAENDIPETDILFGVANQTIIWDNCAGRMVTMARKNDVVHLTMNQDGSYSAHFDYGDVIISDYCGVDVRIVSEQEADVQEQINREQRLSARREISRERYYEDDDFEY